MKKILAVAAILLAWGVLWGCASGVVKVLTDEEALFANTADDTSYGFGANETVSKAGPKLDIRSPRTDDGLYSPVIINIAFIPKKNTQIDLTKLKVEVLKTETIDITKRLAKFTNEKGIYIPKAYFPPGIHKIRITLCDDRGGVTEQILTIRVL